jgi:hypothetical protein
MIKQFYHFDSGTILPFGVFGLPLTRDSYIRFITHYVQNALTSPYCSQNYAAIHLFFHYLCFWTRQNDCIALTAMHLVYCVKPSTHAGLPHPLFQPLHIECINSIPLQPELHWYSSILSISMLLDTLKQFYHFDSGTILPSVVLSPPLTRDSHFASSLTMYRMHWHHPTEAKTTLPFIYSFAINTFGHIKMIE